MSDRIQNENIIATLEQSRQQTLNQRSHLVNRLRAIESEAEGLRQEIETLDKIAMQAEEAIVSLLSTSRASRTIPARQNSLDREMEDISRTPYDKSHQPPPPTHYQPHNPMPNYAPQNANVVSMQRNFRHYIPPINNEVQVRDNRFAHVTITQACMLLLREASEPLHVNELYNRLLEGGFLFSGNNPTISIAVSLNRNRRFRKVAPGTFDLTIRDAVAMK
jgi:hypothetical protein